MKPAFENGCRVPAYDPRDEDDDEPQRPERSGLVMIRRLVGLLLVDPRVALGVECLALVTGIGYDGSSMTEIARRHAVTRAAVSKRCIELCETFGLPPTRAMRPLRNRAKCRSARLRENATR